MRLSTDSSPSWMIRNVEVWEGEERLRHVVAVDTDEGWIEQLVPRVEDPCGGTIYERDERGKKLVRRREGEFRLVDPRTGGRIEP